MRLTRLQRRRRAARRRQAREAAHALLWPVLSMRMRRAAAQISRLKEGRRALRTRVADFMLQHANTRQQAWEHLQQVAWEEAWRMACGEIRAICQNEGPAGEDSRPSQLCPISMQRLRVRRWDSNSRGPFLAAVSPA